MTYLLDGVLLILLIMCRAADESHGVHVGGGQHEIHELADETITVALDEKDVTHWATGVSPSDC